MPCQTRVDANCGSIALDTGSISSFGKKDIKRIPAISRYWASSIDRGASVTRANPALRGPRKITGGQSYAGQRNPVSCSSDMPCQTSVDADQTRRDRDEDPR